jgi:predicted nucleic acid-binding protein
MAVVLDCSLALAWGLPDETSTRADRFLARASRDVFWVPALWWYEIANALTVAHRRRRVAAPEVMRLIELYGALPIQTDTLVTPDVARRLHLLAQEYALSAYDAAYLELAQRRALSLATVDRHLLRAARRAGITAARL